MQMVGGYATIFEGACSGYQKLMLRTQVLGCMVINAVPFSLPRPLYTLKTVPWMTG